jgi:riboflavin kinase/FMN adenylyltransferase
MDVIRGLINVKRRHRGCVVTLGNFDGVHTGHQKILADLNARARTLGVKSIVICFEPQPREFFDEFDAPARLTRFREKVELLAEHGVDYVLCLQFNEKIRSITPDEFIDLLVNDLAIKGLYVGDDFRFGADRSGDYQQLQDAGEKHGFFVSSFDTVVYEERRISSTRIRECLAAGDFELAETLLGHPYYIAGKVIYGRQLGRTLEVPTMNVQLHRYVAPIAGVYACEAEIQGELFQGVANIGVRPTFDEGIQQPVLEVHVFEFDRNVYGQTVKVIFRHKLRDEKKFDGVDELKAAIHADIEHATRLFAGKD